MPSKTPRVEVLDETTALLSPRSDDTSSSSSKRKRPPTPLPKLQIGILMLFQLAEPMTSHCIYPFINQLIGELDITHGDPSRVGYYAGLIQSLFFATEALTVLYWSRLSDRIGRKPVLLVGLSGLCVSMILFGLSRTFWTLAVTRALAGLLNGNIGVIKSMVGELTDSTNMAQAFGIMPVIWATGITIAPLIGGVLSRPYERFPNVFGGAFWHKYPYFLPCFASACFSALSFLLALSFLEETVQKKPAEEPYKQSVIEAQTQAAANQHNTFGGDQPASDLPHATTGKRGRNSSEYTPVEHKDDVLPFRDLLTGPVIISVVNYGALAILDISLSALQPLFFSTPVKFGGLGFSPARIGLVLGLFGLLNGLFQGFCFAKIVGRAGLRRTFMVSMAAFMIIFSLFPIMNKMARTHGVGLKVWAVIVTQLCFWVIMDMAYGCVFMYITSASPTKRSLGSVNGMAQLTASIVRTVGPAASTSLFAVTHRQNILGGCLVYLVFVVLAGLAVALTFQLPAEAWEMDEEDVSESL